VKFNLELVLVSKKSIDEVTMRVNKHLEVDKKNPCLKMKAGFL
jgi:hypothetical protein